MPQQFTHEFKQTILELFNSGKSVAELSREYGVSEPTIYSWLNKKKEIKTESSTITAEEAAGLKKEICRLKEENDILKKATAIFARKN